MAGNLIWEDGPRGWRGSCGTHIYRIEDQIGPYHLKDNQNGWDCFSTLCASIDEAKTTAQKHFDDLINSME